MINSQQYIIHFLYKEKIARDTYTFSFNRPFEFTFLPGQYNRWTLPITALDGRGSSRFFTISSSPFEKDTITFTTKIMQSDFKKALLNLKKNDEIKIFGPMGNFILDETNTKPKVFIAGGIGITPYHSMITYAAWKNLKIPLTLIASYSNSDEMIFYEELKKLEKQHANIKIIYTITKPETSQISWNGEKGRISQDLIKKFVADITKKLFYIVGPPSMEETIKILLNQMQIRDENILTEAFTGY